MEKAKHSIRFEAVVDDDGTVSFVKRVGELRLKPGSSVTVRIFGGAISKRLKSLKVTDEEIEQIGRLQYEDRENVVSFLSAQGVLAKSGFARRTVKV